MKKIVHTQAKIGVVAGEALTVRGRKQKKKKKTKWETWLPLRHLTAPGQDQSEKLSSSDCHCDAGTHFSPPGLLFFIKSM